MQKIEALQPDELLRERQLAEMDTLYVGAYYRGTTNKYLLTFEPDEATWLQFKASVPKGAIIHHQLYWTNGDPTGTEKPAEEPEPKAEKPKKEKEPPHVWGRYWRCWFKPNADGASAIFCPDLVQALALEDDAITAEGVKLALRQALGVDSLSREASPGLFEDFLRSWHLDGLLTRSRGFVAQLEEENANGR